MLETQVQYKGKSSIFDLKGKTNKSQDEHTSLLEISVSVIQQLIRMAKFYFTFKKIQTLILFFLQPKLR